MRIVFLNRLCRGYSLPLGHPPGWPIKEDDVSLYVLISNTDKMKCRTRSSMAKTSRTAAPRRSSRPRVGLKHLQRQYEEHQQCLKKKSKNKRKVAKAARRVEEKARKRCEEGERRIKEEVEGLLAEESARRLHEEELDAEEEEMLEDSWFGAKWCQHCIRCLASNPEHESELDLEKTKCDCCVHQGRGRQGGVDACRPVSVF